MMVKNMCSGTHICIHGRGESCVVNDDIFYRVRLLWFICFPLKIHIWNSDTSGLSVKALAGGDGKWEIHEDEVFRNEVSPLLKEAPENQLPFPSM